MNIEIQKWAGPNTALVILESESLIYICIYFSYDSVLAYSYFDTTKRENILVINNFIATYSKTSKKHTNQLVDSFPDFSVSYENYDFSVSYENHNTFMAMFEKRYEQFIRSSYRAILNRQIKETDSV